MILALLETFTTKSQEFVNIIVRLALVYIAKAFSVWSPSNKPDHIISECSFARLGWVVPAFHNTSSAVTGLFASRNNPDKVEMNHSPSYLAFYSIFPKSLLGVFASTELGYYVRARLAVSPCKSYQEYIRM